MTVGLNAFILVSGLLFAIGMLGVILRKNTLVIYMSLELMLNAVNLALVAFSRYNGTMDGNIFVFSSSPSRLLKLRWVWPSWSRCSASARR